MLNWIVETALKHRIIVLALSVLLIVLGLRASTDVPLDVFPEFAPPMVEVQTEAPGLSSEEVESLITVPLETQVNGLPGLVTLRSSRCWDCPRWCCCSSKAATWRRRVSWYRSVWRKWPHDFPPLPVHR